MSSEGATGLVSVIIPTYRRPEQVREAVQSALGQTWSEIEVIVVSDGPDERTRACLAGMDPRLIYIELDINQGPAAARNAGVAESRGDWLCFLDDDDLMLPGKIAAQMKLADPGMPSEMISCRAIYKRGEREDVWPKRPIGRDEDLAEYILRRPSLLGRPGTIPLQTLLVHRSVVERVAFSTHRDHEDWAWLLEVWHLLGARVRFVWEPLLVYTIATETVSRSRRTNWADSLAWAQQYRQWINDRAFCSFLATKAALKAKRAGDWNGFRTIAKQVLRSKPSALELAFVVGVGLIPARALHLAWQRSLSASGDEGLSVPAQLPHPQP